MHRSVTLLLITAIACSGLILGPAQAEQTALAAPAGADATRVAAPDAAAPDATAIITEPPFERRRWFPAIEPVRDRQALIIQPLLGGTLSSEFGMRRHPVLGTYEGHAGVDYSAPRGTFVFAAADGTVSFAGWDSGYGNTVRITHSDGVETVYAHLSRIEAGVEPGAVVIQGFVVGEVGSTGTATGPNLHFEVHVDGAAVDPLGLGTTLAVAAIDRQTLARLRSQ